MSICSTCTKHQTTFKPQNDNQRIHGSLHTLAANLSHLINSHFFSVNWCSKQDFPTPISPAWGHHPTMYLDCKCCLYTHTDYDVFKNVGIVVRTGSHFCSTVPANAKRAPRSFRIGRVRASTAVWAAGVSQWERQGGVKRRTSRGLSGRRGGDREPTQQSVTLQQQTCDGHVTKTQNHALLGARDWHMILRVSWDARDWHVIRRKFPPILPIAPCSWLALCVCFLYRSQYLWYS